MSEAEGKRDYPTRPFIGVLAVVRRDGKFLLIERRRQPNKGSWGFPGGVQELGESVAEAAMRELMEETGIVADTPHALPPYDHIDRDETGRVRYHFLLVPVLLEWRQGDGSRSNEVADFGWHDETTIGRLPVLPRVHDILAYLRG